MAIIEKEMSQQEIKERIKTFKVMEKVCRRYAEKYSAPNDDREKINCLYDLAISFLGNIGLRYMSDNATKTDYLSMIRTLNNFLQIWFTDALNEIDFDKRKTIQ